MLQGLTGAETSIILAFDHKEAKVGVTQAISGQDLKMPRVEKRRGC